MMRLNALTLMICLVFGLIVYGGDFRLLDDAENRVLDLQFRRRGVAAADPRILIAGIDQDTLAWAGRPMFAWGPLYAELTRAVQQASASALLLDLVFSPGSETAIRDHVRDTGQKLGLDLPQKFFREIGFEKPFRTAMLEFIASGATLIAGFAWEKNQPVYSDPALLHIARRENTGYFNLATSRDGVIRNVQLAATGPTGPVYAVALVAALRSGFCRQIPSASEFRQISFRGPRATIKTIPVRRLIEAARAGQSLADELAGRIVLLGFTDITDFKATPYGYMPGVEIHASILDNIINERFLRPVPRQLEIVVLAGIMVGLLLIARLHRFAAIVAATIAFFAWMIAAFASFDPLVIPVVRPLLLLAVFITSERFLAYRAIYLDRRRVRAIFSRYVSDAVVKEILAANDRDFLQGRRRQLCILIADIRGFTSFSEQRDAHEVVTFLNAYFARLTEIIMANRGVVDKFLGDGLLAFFNAPVEHGDYADDAVRAAMQIIAYTDSPEFKAICYGTDLRVGLAVHAGNVVFGNIGSERKAEFTVIGDTVNACSRMESLNKEFETSLLVSGEVVKSVQAKFNWKFLARTSLRGKANEVELYTISNMEG